jgi:alkylhydroperoxidase family enzyme
VSSSARIAPGTPDQIGRVNTAITRVIGLATGGGPPNVFTTLARHRSLFRRWLLFAGRLMPGGLLPRRDAELVILRVAQNCGSDYEWQHHERLGAAAGLTNDEIGRVRSGPDADGWSPRQRLLVEAADELHADRTISDQLWERLRPAFSENELIELCMLIGHYEMLAMTLNALHVQPDTLPDGPPPRAARIAQRLADKRSGS